ncbi:MAG: hypothetical protein R3F62_08320 [Planctomycetota bacterium]
MRRVLWLLASAAIACAPLGAQDATTYLPLLEDVVPEAPGLLEAFELAQDPEERMAALDALCRLAASREAGSALIARSEGVLRGLRATASRAERRGARALFAEYQQRLVPALEQQGERMPRGAARRPPRPLQPGAGARLRGGRRGDACGWLEAARAAGGTPRGRRGRGATPGPTPRRPVSSPPSAPTCPRPGARGRACRAPGAARAAPARSGAAQQHLPPGAAIGWSTA